LRFEGDAKIDAVITFVELRRMFKEAGITEITVEYSDFDPPKGGKGPYSPSVMGYFNRLE
jgi:iron only hydrogenase large subunit-like protein